MVANGKHMLDFKCAHSAAGKSLCCTEVTSSCAPKTRTDAEAALRLALAITTAVRPRVTRHEERVQAQSSFTPPNRLEAPRGQHARGSPPSACCLVAVLRHQRGRLPAKLRREAAASAVGLQARPQCCWDLRCGTRAYQTVLQRGPLMQMPRWSRSPTLQGLEGHRWHEVEGHTQAHQQ